MDEIIDILLVDDEARNLDALEVILAEPGYRLLRADNADKALHLLLMHDVAAIVLDIKMPGVSGFELAQIIKGSKRFRQIPIVFLTAYLLEDQDVIAGYGAGAVDYLTKPVNPQILRHKIAVFAELFRKTRALAELNATLEERVHQRTAELETSEAALQVSVRQKDEFLAVLAHELRNPLAPLRMGLDMLLQAQPPTAPPSRTLAIMNRQLDHMVRLIDDLLDVSRISRGAFELKKERVNLAALIEAAVETSRPFFEQRSQVVVVDAARPVHAVVDPARLSQILGNLLHNAAKYTPKGGQVAIALGAEDGMAMVRVSDTGVGIPPDKIEGVFGMFARVDRSLPDSDRGLGIGLALAHKLATMHDGTLVATSAGEGHGSTFTLTLRAADPADAKAADPRHAPARGLSARALDILVIEDNPDNADTLAEWLQTQGHTVQVARTGPSGLALATSAQPQLILCDIGLPGMDGVEVCRAIRGLPLAAQPVMIALSGWGMAEDRRRTKDAGFDHHLVKPVAPDTLFELLQSVTVPPADKPDARA